MHCQYCRNLNPEDEPRCQRCGRRQEEFYPVSHNTALAAEPHTRPRTYFEVQDPPLAVPDAPKQARLFLDGSGPKVVPIRKTADEMPRVTSKTRNRRNYAAGDEQAFLDFLPPTPHTPRTLKTSVEAVIYCDALVAPPVMRGAGFVLDLSLITIAMGVFLLSVHICGGAIRTDAVSLLGYTGAYVCIGLFYGMLYVLGGSETAGAHWVGLRLINFDGFPVSRHERGLRFLGACLSVCSGGLGLAWALADEESLTWHDHMSKTFPTAKHL